jgi:serine/threonine-protein kinase RsbW
MTTLTFPGRFDSLPMIADFVRMSAQEAGLSSFQIYAVETAVDEACANIIEHAYGGEDIGNIECGCVITEKGLTIILRDTGRPFNPTSIKNPDFNSSLAERSDHGLGLYFIRQWMDAVDFEFKPGSNTLTMSKFKENQT